MKDLPLRVDIESFFKFVREASKKKSKMFSKLSIRLSLSLTLSSVINECNLLKSLRARLHGTRSEPKSV